MMYKRIFWPGVRAAVWLILVTVAVSACNSSGMTRKQREALEHYVDETADAIVFSATRVKAMLSAYKTKNGSWPKNKEQRRAIFGSIERVLEEHHISSQKLLEVDNNEVVVEYVLSASKFKQFPRMLESWVIIFSNVTGGELEIVSIFPHWINIQEKGAELPFPATQVEKWRSTFQNLLREKLDGHSITLGEQLKESG